MKLISEQLSSLATKVKELEEELEAYWRGSAQEVAGYIPEKANYFKVVTDSTDVANWKIVEHT